MASSRLTVVLSQAQDRHPARRALEESLVAARLVEPGVEVSVIPHLYDLGPDHTGRLFLESVRGDMVVLAWLYPRAAFWLLDRDGIQGREGTTHLRSTADDEAEEGPPPQGIGAVDPPDRHIDCLDLRTHDSHAPYRDEVRRIAAECRERSAARTPPALIELGTMARSTESAPAFTAEKLLEAPDGRRWYPVIDYGRCTNCMECIDFCLFGVYGVDGHGRILVETQDNCKRGCPACSRVCPEHAIMFPEYKTPAIAGAAVGSIDSLKIDLTKLFGGGDAVQIAVQERDRELVQDGRGAVGMSVGLPRRQRDRPAQPKDDLDRLMDSLDALDR